MTMSSSLESDQVTFCSMFLLTSLKAIPEDLTQPFGGELLWQAKDLHCNLKEARTLGNTF